MTRVVSYVCDTCAAECSADGVRGYGYFARVTFMDAEGADRHMCHDCLLAFAAEVERLAGPSKGKRATKAATNEQGG